MNNEKVVTFDRHGQTFCVLVAYGKYKVWPDKPAPASYALWQIPIVIITLGVASSDSNRARHAMVLRENLRRFAAGDALLNVVDPEQGY